MTIRTISTEETDLKERIVEARGLGRTEGLYGLADTLLDEYVCTGAHEQEIKEGIFMFLSARLTVLEKEIRDAETAEEVADIVGDNDDAGRKRTPVEVGDPYSETAPGEDVVEEVVFLLAEKEKTTFFIKGFQRGIPHNELTRAHVEEALEYERQRHGERKELLTHYLDAFTSLGVDSWAAARGKYPAQVVYDAFFGGEK